MGGFGSSLWIWYAIPILLFVLLYYRRLRSGRDEAVRSPLFDGRRASANWPESRLRCPSCGTRNDPAFSYCRNCVSKISDTSGGRNGGGWLSPR